MKNLITRIQIYLMLRRANKLIKITRNADGSKIIDWKADSSPSVDVFVLAAIALMIYVAHIFYDYLVTP